MNIETTSAETARPEFTAWITKYALSTGVYTRNVRATDHAGMVQEWPVKGFSTYYHGEGREWHRTHEGALKRAEALRAAKIKSLKAAITRLQKLKFNA